MIVVILTFRGKTEKKKDGRFFAQSIFEGWESVPLMGEEPQRQVAGTIEVLEIAAGVVVIVVFNTIAMCSS